MSTMKIKPLQWTDHFPPNDECSYDHVFADTPFGRFSIEWKSWKKHDTFDVSVPWQDEAGSQQIESCLTLEGAKASAQDILEQAISQCLED